MSDYTLGQKVRFTHVLRRTWDDGKKFWEAVPVEENEGLVMGKRTLSNGKFETITESDGWLTGIATHTEYRATEHFPAYLIAFDVRRHPVFVRPEHMEAIA